MRRNLIGCPVTGTRAVRRYLTGTRVEPRQPGVPFWDTGLFYLFAEKPVMAESTSLNLKSTKYVKARTSVSASLRRCAIPRLT